MCRSGLWTSTPAGGWMSAAVTSPVPLLAEVHHDGLVVLRGDDELLEVEDDLGDVLGHTGDRRELVQDAVDLDRRDGRTRDRRQQRATQGVAEGVAEAGLQGLDDEPRTEVVDDLFGQGGALGDEHFFFLSGPTAI